MTGVQTCALPILFDLLRRPGVTFAAVAGLRSGLNLRAKSDLIPPPVVSERSEGEAATLDESVAEQVEITAKYAGYIDRQQDEIDRQLANENLRLPGDLDYSAVRGLSKEVQIKLAAQRPETLGQAGRISGITPAALSLLLVHLKKGRLIGSVEVAA